MFGQMTGNAEVQEALGLNDGNTLDVVGNQYVVVDQTGRVYSTCVQHGAANDACDTENLVCWNGQTAGQAGEQRQALIQPAERNDFKMGNPDRSTLFFG